MKVEYRVRPVTRYIVTRYHEGPTVEDEAGNEKYNAGCDPRGEYENADTAYEVASALCKAEHEATQEPPGSMSFIYPQHPDGPGKRVE